MLIKVSIKYLTFLIFFGPDTSHFTHVLDVF